MASRLDNASQGWMQLGDLELLQCENQLHEQAMRETIRSLAQTQDSRTRVLCFLRAPLGGKAVAFAW
jgi:hypothetical protein